MLGKAELNDVYRNIQCQRQATSSSPVKILIPGVNLDHNVHTAAFIPCRCHVPLSPKNASFHLESWPQQTRHSLNATEQDIRETVRVKPRNPYDNELLQILLHPDTKFYFLNNRIFDVCLLDTINIF